MLLECTAACLVEMQILAQKRACGVWVFLFALLHTVQQEEVGLGNVFLPRHAECIFDSHFKVLGIPF